MLVEHANDRRVARQALARGLLENAVEDLPADRIGQIREEAEPVRRFQCGRGGALAAEAPADEWDAQATHVDAATVPAALRGLDEALLDQIPLQIDGDLQ